MILRPVDENGDILPVLSSGDLLRGGPAAAQLVKDRLELYAGEWWENPEQGNRILSLLRESRLTEADGQTLSSYLTSYIRETAGVREIRDVRFSTEGRRFSYSCVVETDTGPNTVHYQL